MIFPVPVLCYLVAALLTGVIYNHSADSSKTALAIGAAQWVASGFLAMAMATILAVVLVTVRWYLWHRRRGAGRGLRMAGSGRRGAGRPGRRRAGRLRGRHVPELHRPRPRSVTAGIPEPGATRGWPGCAGTRAGAAGRPGPPPARIWALQLF